MTVGERIKLKRIELGMSQEELAAKMGYSGKSSVCKAETYGDSITTAKVTKFAKALGVTESYLMGWSNDNSHIVETGILSGKMISRIGDKLTDNDVEHIIKLMELSPDQRAIVFNQVDYLHSMK